jgi:glycosyltransferase involved in cell wall biosynthesis
VTEVHPLSVIEAMAAGLPALGINSPGVGDTIQDGITGYLVAEEELASFTAKLVRLVIETETRHIMAVNARKAAELYAIERTVKVMEEKYHKAVQSASERRVGVLARFNRWLDRVRF